MIGFGRKEEFMDYSNFKDQRLGSKPISGATIDKPMDRMEKHYGTKVFLNEMKGENIKRVRDSIKNIAFGQIIGMGRSVVRIFCFNPIRSRMSNMILRGILLIEGPSWWPNHWRMN